MIAEPASNVWRLESMDDAQDGKTEPDAGESAHGREKFDERHFVRVLDDPLGFLRLFDAQLESGMSCNARPILNVMRCPSLKVEYQPVWFLVRI